jgi:hypothetical protein
VVVLPERGWFRSYVGIYTDDGVADFTGRLAFPE